MTALIDRLADSPALDRAASSLRRLTEHRKGRAFQLARGEFLGHPLHPALTDLPIGLWTSAGVLDIVGGRTSAPAARCLIGWGVVCALPTAATGLVDLPSLPPQKQRVAVVHAVTNLTALILYSLSWRARRHNRPATGMLSAMVAAGLAAYGGYLGGWLAFGKTPELSSHG